MAPPAPIWPFFSSQLPGYFRNGLINFRDIPEVGWPGLKIIKNSFSGPTSGTDPPTSGTAQPTSGTLPGYTGSWLGQPGN